MNKLFSFMIFLFLCLFTSFFSLPNLSHIHSDLDEKSQNKIKNSTFTVSESKPALHSKIKLTEDQKKSLESIRKINDYPVYIMTYFGDYGFAEFLKKGHPQNYTPSMIKEACSAFSALNKDGNIIYGRNLDLTRQYPVLILYTNPPKGYASISVNIGIEIEEYLTNPSDENIQIVLEYPYRPFDGMNEYGVAVSGLNVEGEEVFDPNKISLDYLEIRRLVLDYARNVDEAISLLKQYNNLSSATMHLLVSDAFGNSAIIEYYNQEVHARLNEEPWQAATNFMVREVPLNSLMGICDRYDTIYTALRSYDGLITMDMGMTILSLVSAYQVPLPSGNFAYTVWSSLYDLTIGGLDICPGTQYNEKESFKLDMINDLKVLKARIKPTRLQSKQQYEITSRIVNSSPRVSIKTYLKYYLSDSKEINADSIYLGSKKLSCLKAEEKKTLRIKKKLKRGITPGHYYLIVIADQQSLNNDPDKDNNVFVWKKKIVIK